MVEKQKSKLFNLGIFPNCPFFGSLQAVLIILALIALGTVGIQFLNLWVAVGYFLYSIVYYFLVMPLWLCKYCYFNVKETTIVQDTGETIVKLLPLDKWQECARAQFIWRHRQENSGCLAINHVRDLEK